jgi:hypothetical protein
VLLAGILAFPAIFSLLLSICPMKPDFHLETGVCNEPDQCRQVWRNQRRQRAPPRHCADVVLANPATRVVVLSASAGVTNLLVSLAQGELDEAGQDASWPGLPTSSRPF